MQRVSNGEINRIIGKRIYERRNELGWSQRGLARCARTTQQTISRIEQGKQGMKILLATRIAEALGVSFEYLTNCESSPDITH